MGKNSDEKKLRTLGVHEDADKPAPSTSSAPKPSSKPAAKPAKAKRDGPTVSSAQRARPARRGVATGAVPLRTFIRATKTKDDQLAGFARWCATNKHARMTMKEWAVVLATFHATPVGPQKR